VARLPSLVLLLAVSACAFRTPEAEHRHWRRESKTLAQKYAKSIAAFFPEYVSEMGFDQYEGLTTPYSRTFDFDWYAHSYKWKKYLEKLEAKYLEPELHTDVKILQRKVDLELEEYELNRRIGLVPFVPLTEVIYLNLKELLADGSPKRKQLNAFARFRTYVRGNREQLPMVDGIMAYIQARQEHVHSLRMRGTWPSKLELETYLKDSPGYLKGIRELLAKTPTKVWEHDFKELEVQEATYRDFIRVKMLPYARPDTVLLPALYAFRLKQYDLGDDAEALIETAKQDYASLYQTFRELGKELAEKHKLPKDDPVTVVNYLASAALTDERELLKLYQKTTQELYELVLANKLLTIRKRPDIRIRFANATEAQSLPAPHFISSPLFGEDRDRPSQFVITPTANGRNDFSFKEAAVTLAAHEAVPGHGLQYHAMKERGTTLIRSWFAHNSVNTEGWGLYAEDLVYPFLTKEAQFVTLQRRLWRVARMFLDPELNLGLIRPGRVLELFQRELGFSKPFAESELARYSYIMPGQATSYYYGYKKLLLIKHVLQEKNVKISDRCFNDAFLNLGVLPLDEVDARLKKGIDCDDIAEPIYESDRDLIFPPAGLKSRRFDRGL
jgi:hypothetical protein